MRSPEEVRKVIVRQWLVRAEQDMNAGEALLAVEPPLLYPACFHAQQAAEKYLKALLVWRQIEFPKTHAIEQLLDLLKPVEREIATSLDESAELTPYGVEFRYPSDIPEPGISESHRALELAGKVRDTVLRVIPVE